jgi:hypothetical protein
MVEKWMTLIPNLNGVASLEVAWHWSFDIGGLLSSHQVYECIYAHHTQQAPFSPDMIILFKFVWES